MSEMKRQNKHVQSSNISGRDGRVCNRCSKVPLEGQSLAGTESKRSSWRCRLSTQLTGKAGIKFIFSDTEKNPMYFYSYEEKTLIIQSNEVMMQLYEGKNNVTHGNF